MRSCWHGDTRWRLPASQFGAICKCTTRRKQTKLCKRVVSVRNLVCRFYLQQEPKATSGFETACNVHVETSGTFVDSELPFLSTTQDGVIDCTTIDEVSCFYSARNEVIVQRKLFPYLSDRNCLKEKRKQQSPLLGAGSVVSVKTKILLICCFYIQRLICTENINHSVTVLYRVGPKSHCLGTILVWVSILVISQREVNQVLDDYHARVWCRQFWANKDS